MLEIGNSDVFEQAYMAKFRQLAAEFGEFVTYERDRAARDIGLHLTRPRSGGKKQISNTLCWFQMKGIMENTLPLSKFKTLKEISIPLDVNHLRYWYLNSMPTHLVVYVACADKFLVLNLTEYVEGQWGRGILKLDQKTATVKVSVNSELDRQAFAILLARGDIEQWAKALDANQDQMRLARRDYQLVYQLGTALERRVKHEMHFMDWISKMRVELHFLERSIYSRPGEDWVDIRTHFELGFDPLEHYPYIEFSMLDDDEMSADAPDIGQKDGDEDENGDWIFIDEEYEDGNFISLPNGDRIFGPNCSNEYYFFRMGVRLNTLGRALFNNVQHLVKINMLELNNSSEYRGDFLSIAPWEYRDV